MGNSSSSGGILSDIAGHGGEVVSIAEHPLDAIMLFVGSIILMVVVYKIIMD